MQSSAKPVGKTTGGLCSRRNLVIYAAVLAAIAVGGTVLSAPKPAVSAAEPKARPQQPSLTVDVIAPQPTTFARNLAATGTVRARDELVIGSDASGVRLLEVLVDVGSTVQRGQLLARGDDATLQAQLAQ